MDSEWLVVNVLPSASSHKRRIRVTYEVYDYAVFLAWWRGRFFSASAAGVWLAKVSAVTLSIGSSSKIQTRYFHGSIFRRRQVSMRVNQMALLCPASSLPMKSQSFALRGGIEVEVQRGIILDGL